MGKGIPLSTSGFDGEHHPTPPFMTPAKAELLAYPRWLHQYQCCTKMDVSTVPPVLLPNSGQDVWVWQN